MALLGDGSLAALPGGVEEYLARRASTSTAASAERRERKGDSRAARKELVRLERQLAQLAKREVTLHDELATHATDFARASELNAELRAVVAERVDAEHAWLELTDD